ncbi:beta-glucosidase [Paracoccus isoporae]|uniref:Beta-glucosidase n=1 Tax=Paracoccus isoporae TaxID=591205 RepID=A0A1G7EME1_9RHOB|nr:GH1 family beta-glucosidase [Paracoccus isoporae]SDE64555.1 beta-glucosidase [Paracoccus isoporae]
MFRRSDFPDDFIFGVATSAYQIEGSRFGGAGSSHWDTFANTPGNVVDGSDGSVACDHYHRWEEDLNLIRDGNFDAYRFSTSWARVMPDGRNINAEGMDFYDRLVDGMVARGLKPVLTLHHWDLPSPLASLGGWTNRDIAGWFSDYARAVIGRIGDRVAMTATLNEPWCIAWLSHFMGAHAPGLRDIRATGRAMHHVLLTHGTAIQAMRADGHDNLGMVLNFETAAPATDSAADRKGAEAQDAIYNRWFLEAAMGQGYPAEALAGLEPHLPEGWQQDMDLIATPVDWLGVNHYTRAHYHHICGPWPHTEMVPGPLPKTQIGWEMRPDGLYEFIMRAAKAIEGKGMKLYVTESGMAWYDRVVDGAVADDVRQGYIRDHVGAVQRAMAEGVDVKGFFQWSLLDNYEWALGYGPRFGIVHVDYATQTRTPKGSYLMFRDALSR